MNRMKKIVFLLLFLCSISGFSQTIEDVEALKNEHQDCLDLGENLVDCSVTYYDKTNALFDKVFRRVRERSTPSEKKKLKDEQLLWMNKKGAYFDKIYNDTKEELGTDQGEDFKMMVSAKRADFVNQRIIELIKQL